jgi:hypothetical protein
MKKAILTFLVTVSAAALMAQGPLAQGPGGPGGFGPFGGRGLAIAGLGPGALVTGAPYTATQVVQFQSVLADGNRITNKHQTQVFRDSQGRIRTEETVTPPADSGKAPFTMTTILDPVAGTRTVLNSADMTARQAPFAAGRRGGRPDGVPPGPPPDAGRPQGAGPQRTTTNLGTQSINGVAATGTQTTEVIPAGAIGNAQPITISRTLWIANDLKVPVQIKSSDPRFGTSEMELTNITTSEPSAALFTLPAGYALQAGRQGGPLPAGMGGKAQGRMRPGPKN